MSGEGQHVEEEEEEINFFGDWRPDEQLSKAPLPVITQQLAALTVQYAAGAGVESRLAHQESKSEAHHCEPQPRRGGQRGPHKEAGGAADGEAYSLGLDLLQMLLEPSVVGAGSPPPPPLRVRGLVNSGNACFRNVVLQSLLALPAFVRVLDLVAAHRTALLADDTPLWRELACFFEEMQPPPLTAARIAHPAASDSAQSVLPDDALQEAFRRFRASMGTQQLQQQASTQEDAMEFLTFLLDSLNEEMLRLSERINAGAGSGSGSGAGHRQSSQRQAAQAQGEDWEEVGRRARTKAVVDSEQRAGVLRAIAASPVSAAFHGLYRSEVLYTKQRVNSVTFQRFHCVSLDLDLPDNSSGGGSGKDSSRDRERRRQQQQGGRGGGGAGRAIELRAALATHFREEDMGAAHIKKTLLLERLPQVLVLQLKRFAYDPFDNAARKIEADVLYPRRLTVDPAHLSYDVHARSTADGNSRSSNVFELQALVLHHGGMVTGGHYTAMCRDGFGQWRHFDDAKVSPVTAEEALSQTDRVYLLFYCVLTS